MAFERLVRYEHKAEVTFGNLIETLDDGFKVSKLNGDLTQGFSASGEEAITLLCPLERTPIVQCVGVNYRKHAEEAKMKVPTYPVIFTKPADALTGPMDDIPIHPDCQDKMDYEGELTVVIGRDAKNVTEAHALDYVLGYCIGNDVSCRTFQMPDASGGQFCYCKSFDKFAPIGPAIWSTSLISDPQKLKYVTRVNGEVRQETGTDDMIWSVRQIIAHLSRGMTLRKGTVIMTGTPAGIGAFQKKFLKDGDVVEVELLGFGKVVNKMSFL
ncbi:uncharacterized protein N7482_000027 [Penicillium canariense]|uniref:Fumarylacetoacetase-like C-terminal domain-containing protein n=1 Tax=Penicillium canariense TaxID=189055 RepID=A0A9W9IB09_9EURO|nr:uncharacterized protein N7482_000027 [Penicillium canariense]KAJ5174150.1 hypothetical protein N7482_000027 [Penicillium canariense]